MTVSRLFAVSRRLIPTVLLAGFLVTEPVSALTVWQRVGKKNTQANEQLILSAERVMWGLGDELDMFRVRTALVALSRGDITEARAVVLLHRLRRELRLSKGRNASSLLRGALAGKLEATYRAWAWMELAQVSVADGALQRALMELEQAHAVAWRAEDRAAIEVFMGWLLLREHRGSEAEEIFRRLENGGAPQRLVTQARVGLGLVAAHNGDHAGVTDFAALAYSMQSKRASVSGVDLFWELSLDEATLAGAELVLSWGKAEHAARSGEKETADEQRRHVCDSLYGDSEWVQLLAQIWRDRCPALE